jgi:type I restriction enzyme S subunit
VSTEWIDCLLGDILTLQRGFDLPERERVDGDVPIISSSGTTGFHNVHKATAPGVVTGRYGTLGEVHYVTKDFWPLNTTLYVKEFKGTIPLFVAYLLRTLNLSSQNAAGAVPGVNRNHLHMLTVRVPPLPVQHKIASVLSAYDDLIENNTRRIAILEEMAQSLYRQWFVEYRFPRHEKARFVDSPLGRIPEGWKASDIGSVSVNFDRLRKPLSSMQRANMKGLYPYYGAAKIFDYINEYLFDGEYLLLAEDGSVITADRKPVLQLAYGKFWVNNHAHILQGRSPVSTQHLYLALTCMDVSGYVTGSAQPKITQANMNRMPFLLATEVVEKEFTATVLPIFREREVLGRKTEILRQTRDLLLPKLMSGQLDVEDLDIDTGETLAGVEA